jgi:hypothetical protein
MLKNSLKYFLKLLLISSSSLFLILLVLYCLQKHNYNTEIIYGYLGSLFIFSLGFVSIVWSLKRSLKTFMSVVLGGIVVKFVLLAILIFLIMKYTNFDILYFVIIFVVFYIFYQLSEFRFINTHVRKGKKWGVFTSGV